MIQLDLTQEEEQALEDVLPAYLSDLSYEVANTDDFDFREGLKAKRALLETVANNLKASRETGGWPEYFTSRTTPGTNCTFSIAYESRENPLRFKWLPQRRCSTGEIFGLEDWPSTPEGLSLRHSRRP